MFMYALPVNVSNSVSITWTVDPATERMSAVQPHTRHPMTHISAPACCAAKALLYPPDAGCRRVVRVHAVVEAYCPRVYFGNYRPEGTSIAATNAEYCPAVVHGRDVLDCG